MVGVVEVELVVVLVVVLVEVVDTAAEIPLRVSGHGVLVAVVIKTHPPGLLSCLRPSNHCQGVCGFGWMDVCGCVRVCQCVCVCRGRGVVCVFVCVCVWVSDLYLCVVYRGVCIFVFACICVYMGTRTHTHTHTHSYSEFAAGHLQLEQPAHLNWA